VRARVLIRPKAGILDPQGAAVERALPALGFAGVENVHVGRLVELDVVDAEQLGPMCEKLLANPLVEDYEIVLVDNGAPPQGFTGPVNSGLRAARGRYAVVMNDDVEVLPGETFISLDRVEGPGGLPVGAYGGRADLMDLVAPAGPVYQAGTLSGHPLVMAAGIATLELLDNALYARLEEVGADLEAGLTKALPEARIARVGSLLTAFFASTQEFARFFHRLRDRGVVLAPSQFEAWFLSAAHGDPEIARTLDAARAR